MEHVLITEQAGFRPGKYCTAQVLNLTQHIVYLSAADDTGKHRRLLEKVYSVTRDYRLMCMIRTLLENRRFFVELREKRSRWRSQRNDLPQGSVLAPLLFTVYTNDQPIHPGTGIFVYADDLACHYTEHRLCTNRGNTDLSSSRTVGGLYRKPAPRESDKDAIQPLPSAESRMWQTAQHQLERCEPTVTSRCNFASHQTERCHIKHTSRRPKRKSEQETTSSAN